MPLSDLRTVPEPVTQTAAALASLDEAFVSGFGRLANAHLETLAGLQRAFSGTPIGEALAAAVAGLGRSEFIDRHFAVLAVARSAAHGAMHDALQAQACAALGRPRPVLEDIPASAAQAPPPRAATLLDSTRQWLMELAIAGFANLEVGSLMPFQATLDAILEEPSLIRIAALLTGFLDELLAMFPAHGTPEIPRARWVDLWSRAMVLALTPVPAARDEASQRRAVDPRHRPARAQQRRQPGRPRPPARGQRRPVRAHQHRRFQGRHARERGRGRPPRRPSATSCSPRSPPARH
jgi:hypothetical protein